MMLLIEINQDSFQGSTSKVFIQSFIHSHNTLETTMPLTKFDNAVRIPRCVCARWACCSQPAHVLLLSMRAEVCLKVTIVHSRLRCARQECSTLQKESLQCLLGKSHDFLHEDSMQLNCMRRVLTMRVHGVFVENEDARENCSAFFDRYKQCLKV